MLNVGRFEAPLSICPPTIRGACRWGVDIKVKLVVVLIISKRLIICSYGCHVMRMLEPGEVLQGIYTIKPGNLVMKTAFICASSNQNA